MKVRLLGLGHVVVVALASKEARGPELALARIVLGALAVKLGLDFSKFV